mmetsp:Transcript_2283/g.2759  ORF Transcript_2283/g.2759 Transcript_2283/m.2759 type:complete len:209 (-) Transcript_2283:204-830(-)
MIVPGFFPPMATISATETALALSFVFLCFKYLFKHSTADRPPTDAAIVSHSIVSQSSSSSSSSSETSSSDESSSLSARTLRSSKTASIRASSSFGVHVCLAFLFFGDVVCAIGAIDVFASAGACKLLDRSLAISAVCFARLSLGSPATTVFIDAADVEVASPLAASASEPFTAAEADVTAVEIASFEGAEDSSFPSIIGSLGPPASTS